MARVSEYYGIRGRVNFVDVDVSNDNRLYVDPRAVRLQRRPSPYASRANRCTSTFFDEVVECIRSDKRRDSARGLDLLQHFREPKETRLGMSKQGIDGRGGAHDVGASIWNVLSSDAKAFVRVGVLRWIEDVPLFVYGVDKDITSDLTTRIIFEPLARFTQAMVQNYPEFARRPHRIGTFRRQSWDARHRRWVDKEFDLPVADGEPLVLVPRDWVRPRLMMSSARYYATTLLSFVQEERAVLDRTTGKLLTEPKKRLREMPQFQRGQATIVRVTEKALRRDEDLVDRFRAFVDARYEPLDDDVIDKRTR